MKRRRFMQALAAAPAAPVLVGQQPASPPATPAASPAEPVSLDLAVADEAADPVTKFFSVRQYATLRRLCDVLVPASQGVPGAIEARVPEFMDFLIGDAPAERQQVWARGLDALDRQSQTRFQRPFADTDGQQAEALMAPLREPWTYDEPSDPVARLLRAAKQDVRLATMNSLERTLVATGGVRRRGGGGLYWLPVE